MAFNEKEYIIPYKGLKEGIHNFEYNLNQSFIDHFKSDEIHQLNMDAWVVMNYKTRFIEMEISVKGTYSFECDRCLEEVAFPVDFTHSLVFKIEGTENNFDDEILFLSEDEHQLNIAPFIFETIVFSLPLKRVHGNDKKGNSLCNPEMLEKLNDYLVEEPEEENPTDPRWDELKKLLNN